MTPVGWVHFGQMALNLHWGAGDLHMAMLSMAPSSCVIWCGRKETQVGYAWFMMPMGQNWGKPSTQQIRFDPLGTMIRPWGARDFFTCFSRTSQDTARLRTWSRAKSRLWASLSRMVLSFFVWSEKSFSTFKIWRLRAPWAVHQVSGDEEVRSFARHRERSADRDWIFSFNVGSFCDCSPAARCSH